ncbi:MAG: Cna B-type domain-containing protein [Firmicutes bacterium]|nr:Cna B-type domain-containing protein [Bacillota bacterium]
MINLNIKSKKWFMFIICTILSVALLPVCAFAKIPVTSSGSSSLTIVCKDKGTPLEGITYDLYKIADTDDKGGFSLTKEFENYSISFEQDSAEDIRALAKTLSLYAIRDEIPFVSQAKTGKNGKALLRNLSAGLYLAYGHKYTDKEKDFTYTPEPILVNLKKAGSPDSPFYNITVNSKGGIGGGDTPETTVVKVLKVWDDKGNEENRPSEIEAELLRNGKVYDTVILNAKNNWKYTWKNLSPDYEWSVVEKSVPRDYSMIISKEGITYVLTNKYHPELTTVEAEKVWNDKGHEKERPKSIEVTLFRSGEEYETVILSDTNGWKYTWTDLDPKYTWTVKEASYFSEYTQSVEQKGGKFTITNTYIPLEPPAESENNPPPVNTPPTDYPDLPQTGQLWWPIPILILSGLLFYAAGFVLNNKTKNDD